MRERSTGHDEDADDHESDDAHEESRAVSLLGTYYRSVDARPASLAARFSDLLLVVGIIAIVAMMVVPLPPWLIDFLVAINMTSGVVLILLSIYITGPLELSVFPSVLLMTTLFRLALSIATTRMILLEAHAGHIIDAFGKFVAGGNLIVGLVVFLIITVVQFIVIAKGAERVAEVAARFTLDAMPGKQLSIDSDLRSGLIDKDEARRRRRSLEMESKMHGSLDGAMKFVKGDAIASIVIIVLNLLGGLAIGMLQRGMGFADAGRTYSILTIGEGMVAQLPALLGAIAAGLLVTRATDEEHDLHLGDAIRKQFTAKPRVYLVTGAICVLLALVPGFPASVFLLLGVAAGTLGVLLVPAWREAIQARLPRSLRHLPGHKPAEEAKVAVTQTLAVRPSVPLLLRVPPASLRDEGELDVRRAIERMLDDVQITLGLPLPRVSIYGDATADGGWELLAYEVPIARGDWPADGDPDALAHAVRQALRRHAAMFVGVQETTALLTRASADLPDVVKEVLRALPMQKVAEVLRRLISEEVSIRNLRDILEALADAGQREKDVQALTEFARIALKRQISYRVASKDGRLAAILLRPEVEDLLRQAVRTTGGVSQLALETEVSQALVASVKGLVDRLQPHAIVVSVDLRWHLRKLIEPECFDVPVLSFHELAAHLRVEVVAHLALPGSTFLEAA